MSATQTRLQRGLRALERGDAEVAERILREFATDPEDDAMEPVGGLAPQTEALFHTLRGELAAEVDDLETADQAFERRDSLMVEATQLLCRAVGDDERDEVVAVTVIDHGHEEDEDTGTITWAMTRHQTFEQEAAWTDDDAGSVESVRRGARQVTTLDTHHWDETDPETHTFDHASHTVEHQHYDYEETHPDGSVVQIEQHRVTETRTHTRTRTTRIRPALEG